MVTFENIYQFINFLPKYMIPYEYLDICWYIKILNNKDFEIITPKEVIINLKNIFGDYKSPNQQFLNERLESYLNFLKNNSKIKFLRSGKIIFEQDKIPDNKIQCDNCGNIWDGNAKCNCYLYSNEFGEYCFLI